MEMINNASNQNEIMPTMVTHPSSVLEPQVSQHVSYLDKNTQLFFVRHGQTVSNVNGTIVGQQLGVSLTEKGENEAYNIGQALSRSEVTDGSFFDYIITSPLERADNTAEIIKAALLDGRKKWGITQKLDIIRDDRIQAQNFGVLEGKKVEEVAGTSDAQYLHKPGTNVYTHFVEGGETVKEVQEKRVHPFLEDLVQQYEGKRVLIVTHNGICRIVTGHMETLAPEVFTTLQLGNVAAKVYELAGGVIYRDDIKEGRQLKSQEKNDSQPTFYNYYKHYFMALARIHSLFNIFGQALDRGESED